MGKFLKNHVSRIVLAAICIASCGKGAKNDSSSSVCTATEVPTAPPAAGLFTFTLSES